MKRIFFFIVIVTSVFIINNLVQSIYNLWSKQDLLGKAKKELVEEKKKHAALQKELKWVSQDVFIEKEARNKLFLVKPGEKIVVLPRIAAEDSGAKGKKEKVDPNWKKWWDLFF